MKHQSVKVLVTVLLIFAVVTCCLAHDCEQPNEAARQQLTIQTEWLWTSQEIDAPTDDLKTSVEEHLNKLLPNDHIKVAPTKMDTTPLFNGDRAVAMTFSLTADSKSSQSGAVSVGLLMALKSLVDCDEMCITSTGKGYLLAPSENFKTINAKIPTLLNTGRVRVFLVDNRNQSNLDDSFECKKLCDQISTVSSYSDIFSLSNLNTKMHSAVVTIVSMLDPQNWVVLIVSIWLMVCLVIAMLIKRQDRRKLRLHLEERAEYSFSKLRDRA